MPVLAFLALGANLGDPVAQVAAAMAALDAGGARILRRARLYRSRPLGPPGQPDYLNTAVAVETALPPVALLDLAKRVEAGLGRVPGVRWGPRVIDVDLALYGAERVQHERLTVPHPELRRRRFVLAPLADLAPGHVVPGDPPATVAALLAALDDDPADLEVLDPSEPDRDALGLGRSG